MTDLFNLEEKLEPIVSIIVVNYNGHQHLADCLDSLYEDNLSPRFEIIVVDNASIDNSWKIVDRYLQLGKSLTLLRSDRNRGYSGGVNFAFPQTTGEFIAVLNMDTIVSPGWLSSVVNFFESHPDAGAVSPLMLLNGDPERINAIGQSVHVTALGFNRGLGKLRSEIGQEPIRVSGIQGGAFVIRRSVLEQIGGLDEVGFLYHEDVDISWQLQLMGYELYCLPVSIVYHDYALTMYPEKLYLLERNRVAMLLGNLEPIGFLVLIPWLFFTEFMMWGYCLLRGRNYLIAKAASCRWVYKQREYILLRRQFVRLLRRRSDWQVLRNLSWGYAWDQFITLGRERGRSKREPRGGIPVEL